jgi:hypothetical protein
MGINRYLSLRGVDVSKPMPNSNRGLKLVADDETFHESVDETALEVEIFDLGSALRRGLFRDTLDWEILTRIESFLFHHSALAFRWLKDIFEDAGEELRPHVAEIHRNLMNHEGLTPFQASRNRELCYRLLSILQVVCPEVVSLQASAA